MCFSLRKFAIGLLCFVVALNFISFFVEETIATQIRLSNYASVFWLTIFIFASKLVEAFTKPFNHHQSKGE